MTTATENRPQMTIDEIASRLAQSDDPVFQQLGKNLGAAKESHDQDREASGKDRWTEGGNRELGYAAVRTGAVVKALTEDIFIDEFDESQLSEKQSEFFESVRETFPYTAPRSIDEDGTITFHGRGQIFLMDREGEITGPIGKAPDCPECASCIMGKIDRGYSTAQCDNCGNALTAPPSDD